MTECCCETGKAWGSHKMKRLRLGHNLPRTAEAGSTLHSRAYPGHALKDNKVRYVCARQGENIGLSSHSSQAEGASAENGLAQEAPLEFLGAPQQRWSLKLGPSCQVNQTTS